MKLKYGQIYTEVVSAEIPIFHTVLLIAGIHYCPKNETFGVHLVYFSQLT